MPSIKYPAESYTDRVHGAYTPFSDAPHEERSLSLAEQLGGEPYPQHPTRWYEWLATALHVALLAAGIALMVFG